jgi:hypothetical protein
MSKLAKKEKNMILFNIYGDSVEWDQVAIMPLNLGAEIKTAILPELISKDGNLQNLNDLAESVLTQAGGLAPVLNIEFDSNKAEPLVNAEYIKSLKKLGVHVSFTFAHYNEQEEQLRNIWQPLLDQADHVFFAKEEDRGKVVAAGHLSFDKADYPLEIPLAPKLDSEEILKRPANILLQGPFKSLDTIHQVVKAAKELGNNTKIVIDAASASNIDIANAIAAKFTIEDPDDLKNFHEGLSLEIAEILKGRDKASGTKKLEEYVKQLSMQFEQDGQASKVNNIIDINFDQSKSSDIHKQTKYIITEQGKKTYSNGCIHLKAANNSSDIVNEVKAREEYSGDNKDAIEQMQKILDEPKLGLMSQLIKFFKNIVTGEKQERNLEVVSIVPDDLIDQNHLYEDYEIYALFKAQLNPEKVHIQYPCALNNKIDLQSAITEAVESMKAGKEDAIIPINTGGHWVGLTITKDDQNKLVFTYQDPAGSNIDVRPGLEEAIIKADRAAIIKDEAIIQQFGDVNCGVLVVDNSIKLVKKEAILSPEDSEVGFALRIEHANILKNKDQQEKLREEAVKIANSRLYPVSGERNLPLKPGSSHQVMTP